MANPNYLASSACSEELRTALECEKVRRTEFGLATLRTVFGICPEPDKVPSDLRSGLWWFQYETELCEAMQNQLTQIAPRLSNIESFSFQDWPHGLLTDDGDLDLAIICGSTGKEAPLGETDSERAGVLQPLAPFLTIDDQMEIQSARPAEYLPFLTSSLERLSRRKKTNLKMPDADRSASVPEVYCDRTAIRFYPSVFAESSPLAGATQISTRGLSIDAIEGGFLSTSRRLRIRRNYASKPSIRERRGRKSKYYPRWRINLYSLDCSLSCPTRFSLRSFCLGCRLDRPRHPSRDQDPSGQSRRTKGRTVPLCPCIQRRR